MYDSVQEAIDDGKRVCMKCGRVFDDEDGLEDHDCSEGSER